MNAKSEGGVGPNGRGTAVDRRSERELVITRAFKAPAPVVFETWTKHELFKLWWAPKSCGLSLLSCEMDVRVGGSYRLEFSHPASEQPMAFFGRYIDVVPHSRLAWTNDEGGDGGPITTVTFEQTTGETLVVKHDLYPTKKALDDEITSGGPGAAGEQYDQLDQLLVTLGSRPTST